LLWKRLFILLVFILALCLGVLAFGSSTRTGILVFLIGNIGGYVGFHKSLGDLKDSELIDLAKTLWSIVAPAFVGGVLALVLYMVFLSGILAGDLFPKFLPDKDSVLGVESVLNQHALDMPAYAKLFVWSFIGGFNQKYVVDIINSVKPK
jgi:hypothetical protein